MISKETKRISEVFGALNFGGTSADEWVLKKLATLRGEDEEPIKLEDMEIEVSTLDEISVVLGRKVREGVIVYGFSAGFVKEDLRMLSVFTFSSGKLTWIRKEKKGREKIR